MNNEIFLCNYLVYFNEENVYKDIKLKLVSNIKNIKIVQISIIIFSVKA